MAEMEVVFEMTLKEVRVEMEYDDDQEWKVIPKQEYQNSEINWCRGWRKKGDEFSFIWQTMQDPTVHSTGSWATHKDIVCEE